MKVNTKIQKALPIVLSALASIGVIGTSIMVSKETVKAKPKMDAVKAENNKKKLVKEFIKDYKWSLILGGATISSIISGTIISKKIEASLSATVVMLNGALLKYKGKVQQVLGPKAKEITHKIVGDEYEKVGPYVADTPRKPGSVLYYNEYIGWFFAKPENINRAEALTNEKIHGHYRGPEKIKTDGWASLETFFDDCKAEVAEFPDNPYNEEIMCDFNWCSEYINEVYGFNEFLHVIKTPHYDANHDIDYIILEFDKEPIYNSMDYSNWPTIHHYDDEEAVAGQDEEGYINNDNVGGYSTKNIESTQEFAQEFADKILERKKG